MKLKGFTIIEITVVMLITSLVVSLGYGGYMMMTKFHASKLKQHQHLAEVNRLRQIVAFECFQSDSVFWNGEIKELRFRENRKLMFEDSIVVMNIGVSDTIWVDNSNVKMEQIQLKNGSRVVSDIFMDLELNNETIEFQVRKDYTEYFKTGL